MSRSRTINADEVDLRITEVPPSIFSGEPFRVLAGLVDSETGESIRGHGMVVSFSLRYAENKSPVPLDEVGGCQLELFASRGSSLRADSFETEPREDNRVPCGESGSVECRCVVRLPPEEEDRRGGYLLLEGLVEGSDVVGSVPLHVIRSRLSFVRNLATPWYRDEGGKEACIEGEVELVGETGLVVTGKRVPLTGRLVYDSTGALVEQQDILVIMTAEADDGRDWQIDPGSGRGRVRFRISDVSKNHQQRAFSLQVQVRKNDELGTIDPALRDIGSGRSSGVIVRSKRTKKQKRSQTPLDESVPPPSLPPPSSREPTRRARPSVAQQPVAPVLARGLPEENERKALNRVTAWVNDAIQLVMRHIQWVPAGLEYTFRSSTRTWQADSNLPIFRCPSCGLIVPATALAEGKLPPHRPGCMVGNLISEYYQFALPNLEVVCEHVHGADRMLKAGSRRPRPDPPSTATTTKTQSLAPPDPKRPKRAKGFGPRPSAPKPLTSKQPSDPLYRSSNLHSKSSPPPQHQEDDPDDMQKFLAQVPQLPPPIGVPGDLQRKASDHLERNTSAGSLDWTLAGGALGLRRFTSSFQPAESVDEEEQQDQDSQVLYALNNPIERHGGWRLTLLFDSFGTLKLGAAIGPRDSTADTFERAFLHSAETSPIVNIPPTIRVLETKLLEELCAVGSRAVRNRDFGEPNSTLVQLPTKLDDRERALTNLLRRK